MKIYYFVPLLIATSLSTSAVPLSMYMSIKPTNCNSYSYEIELTYFGDPVSNLAIGGSMMFGDGTYQDIRLDDEHSYQEIAGRIIRKYKYTHSFPGPGIYTVQLRSLNRDGEIINMSNSASTPYFIETQIVIDPYIGCNTTPKMENMHFFQKTGFPFNQNFSFHDIENDSISYQLVIPLQDDEIEVIDYWFPMDFDQMNMAISKISLDRYNGTLAIDGAGLSGDYAVALDINEWRKIDNQYYKISQTRFDLNMFFHDTENNPPAISSVRDTVIVAGDIVKFNIQAEDPENDPILLRLYGDLLHELNLSAENTIELVQSPIFKDISFTPNNEDIRDSPYKLITSAVDENLDASLTSYVWIADKNYNPGPVENFTAQKQDQESIILNWIDVSGELGYIIERSDTHFPEFKRLVVLPTNSISFVDPSIVPGNTYKYRIKAVGTTMSPYKTVEISTTDIITSLESMSKSLKVEVFPNPTTGTFQITNCANLKALEIYDISGNLVFSKSLLNPSASHELLNISTDLPKGTYLLYAELKDTVLSKKLIIN